MVAGQQAQGILRAEKPTVTCISCLPSESAEEEEKKEERKKKEDDKIKELDDKSTQKLGNAKFNKDVDGDFADANKDFDDFQPENVRPTGKGGRVGDLSDGKTINVRPTSSNDKPTLGITKPNKRPFRKYRYTR